jgi:hypothetical protein
MSSPVVTAGTRIYISDAVPVTNDVPGFEALTFTQIKGVRMAGELGNSWQTRDEELIDDSQSTFKRKTFLAQVPFTLEVITLVGDAGQALLQVASGVIKDCSFKVERSDGGKRYFVGQVISFEEVQGGNGKQLFDATSNIAPQQKVVFS